MSAIIPLFEYPQKIRVIYATSAIEPLNNVIRRAINNRRIFPSDKRGLTSPYAPLRHKATRRRIKTVMQELIYLAGKFIETCCRLKIKFGI